MSIEQVKSQYPDAYQSVEATLPGQPLSWLQDFRTEAKQEFSQTGFPSLHEEEWRYTNVSALEKKLFLPVAVDDIGVIDLEVLQQHLINEAYSLVLVDGHFSEALSDLQDLGEGITVLSMADALAKQPEQVKRYLGKAVKNQENGFVAFNNAWFSDGVLIQVSENTVVDKPIQVLHIMTQAGAMANTRHIVALETSAQAQIIETFVGCDAAYCSTAVAEIFVGKNADLTLYKLQTESEKAYHFGGIYVKQARDSRFKHHNFAFGSLLARTDVHTDLQQAAECDLNGLYLGVKRQHLDSHTRINHLEPQAVSRELYKGVLNQRARGVFQGRVLVAEGAQKTDSDMHNHNLLLSDDAEADTKPQLEIYADDVKCAHGITVGQLDEKSIFYLQSRCVDEEAARNMLTFAFANEMVDKITLPALHDKILTQVLAKFPQAGIQQEWL